MLPGLAFAALLAAAPSPSESPIEVSTKAPKPTPEERLAQLDQRRVALNFGIRGYGRFLEAPPASGAGVELGLGVRLVRGLYLQAQVDVGAYALPVGASGRAFLGVRHELRMSKWVRPSFSLGYTHLFQAEFDTEFGGSGCACPGEHNHGGDFDFGFDADAEPELATRGGVQAGLGLRFPFRKAPRLSLYLRSDASYYFDDRPGRLQVGGSLGFMLVF